MKETPPRKLPPRRKAVEWGIQTARLECGHVVEKDANEPNWTHYLCTECPKESA